MEKEVCEKCKKNIAVWFLMSGYGFYCDDCVPRSCTCNNHYVKEEEEESPDTPPTELKDFNKWKWLIPGKIWCWLDEEGREYPCCEFDYEKEGYILLTRE